MKKLISVIKTYMIIIFSIICILIVWQIASHLLGSDILLPSVFSVLKTFVSLFSNKTFTMDVSFTIYRAFKSFVIIVISSSILGVLGGKYKAIGLWMNPILTVLKSTPVMSVILLAFIWFQTGTVPVFSAFLMAFPIMYMQMETGYKSLEDEMIQMCNLYGFTKQDQVIHYIIPSLTKSFIIGSKQTLSMIWKVVIAAEVLTVPKYGVGSKMQLSQMQLETGSVLAWTLVAIMLTALGDLLFYGITKMIASMNNSKKRSRAL